MPPACIILWRAPRRLQALGRHRLRLDNLGIKVPGTSLLLRVGAHTDTLTRSLLPLCFCLPP